jgi:cell division transport system ATP-binding protein
VLRLDDVSKLYPRGAGPAGVALEGVSLALGRGEFAFLTGPSGSGKSTILKLAYFEERPTTGVVETAGVRSDTAPPRDVPLLRRQLGVVFQDFRLLPDRTAEQNVAFALEVTGTARAAVRDRVSDALARVGLAGRGPRFPHELSGGEQQRVAIARALVNRPVLLLADEPTGNLDERAAQGVYELLREVHAAGTAVLMATHHAELVARAGLRVITIERGRLAGDTGAAALTPPLPPPPLPPPPLPLPLAVGTAGRARDDEAPMRGPR